MTHVARIEKIEDECRGVWADAGDHTKTRTIRATVWYGRSYFAAASRHHRCQPIRPARHSRQSV